MSLFCIHNGKVMLAEQLHITPNNRAYLYGDGVFESIRVFNGNVINLENHLTRLIDGAKALKMRIPVYFTVDFFQKQMNTLLEKNQVKGGGKIRLSIDRIPGGNYTPDNDEPEFLMEFQPLAASDFELNTKGFEIDLFTDIKKDINKFSNFKTKNGLLYVMAGITAKEKGIDDVLIHNKNGGIIESSSSNLFLVSNGVLYTPGLEEGCLAGTMRMQIINLALQSGYKIYECTIMPQNLLAADEVFLTNAIKGISWVVGYRTKRYYNNTSRKLVALLNDHWEKKIKALKSEGDAPLDLD